MAQDENALFATLKTDFDSFYEFVRASLRAIDSAHPWDAESKKLLGLRSALTEQEVLFEGELRNLKKLTQSNDAEGLRATLSRILPKSAPTIHHPRHPTAFHADLSRRSRRSATQNLLTVFSGYPVSDLKLFDAMLDLERENLGFDIYGEADRKAFLPLHGWIAFVAMLAWTAFLGSLYDIGLDLLWEWFRRQFTGGVLYRLVTFFIWLIGLLFIFGYTFRKYEIARHSSKLAHVSRWLKLYIQAADKAAEA